MSRRTEIAYGALCLISAAPWLAFIAGAAAWDWWRHTHHEAVRDALAT